MTTHGSSAAGAWADSNNIFSKVPEASFFKRFPLTGILRLGSTSAAFPLCVGLPTSSPAGGSAVEVEICLSSSLLRRAAALNTAGTRSIIVHLIYYYFPRSNRTGTYLEWPGPLRASSSCLKTLLSSLTDHFSVVVVSSLVPLALTLEAH